MYKEGSINYFSHIKFDNSVKLLTFTISIFLLSNSQSGKKILLNHIFSASFNLFSSCIGFFIFPVREISHTKIVSFPRAMLFLLEIIETAIERSIPGSSIFNHLAIFV
ncbi:MAG: hypothetical protein LBF15_03855 [Candidatus Peribacteria bacterium]|nr:hypothetical protein [Candidatus Peribacteria bacterium]